MFKNNDNTDATFRTDTTVKNLLDLDIMEVTKLLTAFGNYERFKIIILLLDKGRTVNEIVKELGFPTTGKAYHHLNALMSAGLLIKSEEGKYRFKARYIQGVLAMLVGCHSYISKSRDEIISEDNL
jgi:predicted transcriptional regulator